MSVRRYIAIECARQTLARIVGQCMLATYVLRGVCAVFRMAIRPTLWSSRHAWDFLLNLNARQMGRFAIRIGGVYFNENSTYYTGV